MRRGCEACEKFRYLTQHSGAVNLQPLLNPSTSTRVQRLVTEYMQVPVLVNICPVSLKKVPAYVQSLTAVPTTCSLVTFYRTAGLVVWFGLCNQTKA